jgi:hypothetical protein
MLDPSAQQEQPTMPGSDIRWEGGTNSRLREFLDRANLRTDDCVVSVNVELIAKDDGEQPVGVWSLIQRPSKLDITRTQARKMFRSGEHPVIPGLPKLQGEALKVEFEALGATVRLGSAGSDG